MGTTATALAEGSGQFGFALLIEGYPYVLTDAADVSAVVTAYAATEWEAALPGLKVIGGISQSIEPFKEELDKPEITVHVQQDSNDTFGKAVWKSKPSISSRLTDPFLPGTNGSGSLKVKDNATGPSDFPSSGIAYLGTRTISYSALADSETITVPAGGASVYLPFTADGSNTYSVPGNMAEGQNFDVAAPPRVSNVPATWHGKKVALYIHRIVGGVWDTKAQAHLEFAGTIVDLSDGEGITVIKCRDLRRQIEDALIHKNQWRGYVKPGIYLRAGDRFKVGIVSASPSSSGEFTVVASGASGTDECNAGLYDYAAFLAMLELWVDGDSSIDADSAWAFYAPQREQGVRTVIRMKHDTSALRVVQFYCTSVAVLEFMGFGGDFKAYQEWQVVAAPSQVDDEIHITSSSPPYRIRALQSRVNYQQDQTIDCTSSEGTWWNHSAYLPEGIHGLAADGNWSYVVIGESQLAIAEYDDANTLINATPIAGFGEVYDKVSRDFVAPGVTYDDPSDARLEVRQLVFLTGKFSELMPRLFASIGGTPGVNHDDYDEFPSGAAIPWSLLGDDFVNSCRSLETSEGTDTISIRMDRPTRLREILIPELALRFAFLVFKDGGYRFVSPPVPNSVTADWTLGETNKAVGPGESVPMTTCEWSKDYMCNVVSIQYRRTHDGKFIDHVTVKDSTSIAVHGETDAVDIDAVNSVSDRASVSGSTVEALASNLSVRLFPMFGKPVKLITRSIAPPFYGIAPGDTVAISDDLIRDPTTGERGISGRAAVCISSFHDYGHEGGRLSGEVTLLMSDEDRTFPLSAAAEIDTTYTAGAYTNGYDNTNKRLKLKDHAFSKSTAAKDAASFTSGDLVRIVELDPASPSSIDAWSRTLDGVDTSTGYLQMTATLSSPAYSGATKKFVVIPQEYTSCTTSQKLKAFQADEGAGNIMDVIEPNLYGISSTLDYNDGASTDLPVLMADEAYGDGKPLTPYHLNYLTRGANNLINYKTATHCPVVAWADDGTEEWFTVSEEWQLRQILCFYVGGFQIAGRERYISVAPQLRRTASATSCEVKVTSSRFPPVGDALTDPGFKFIEPARSVEFTTTSQALVTATAQDLLPVPGTIPGHTWLSVSIKRTGAAGQARCSGLPILYLKAIT